MSRLGPFTPTVARFATGSVDEPQVYPGVTVRSQLDATAKYTGCVTCQPFCALCAGVVTRSPVFCGLSGTSRTGSGRIGTP